ncbi:hypothetical protein V6N12_076080 [Hibiscus sabdariffa]|uniref:Uncharacterized protein n=1 Tax=Hibiscus sabdariffa TaxID=183260 RepID=A0ABR2AYT8_9ROSI
MKEEVIASSNDLLRSIGSYRIHVLGDSCPSYGSPTSLASMGGSLRAENEEEPRIFLSTVLLEAPLSPLNKKDCTALGPGSEGNELGCFSSTLIFLRARSACASRAIGALLSSYSSLDDSDGLRRSFPTKINRKGCITSRCRFVFRPQ